MLGLLDVFNYIIYEYFVHYFFGGTKNYFDAHKLFFSLTKYLFLD